ncbi:outer membrane beta-barrel protein [Haliscomenobacter sp.]|uniref:outer membrane beta-barrel protein n=1 Tax=Haliscomenobacter sp. TaxID=2717303 RepID=UPI003BA8F386
MKNLFTLSLILLAFALQAQKNTPAIGRVYGKLLEATTKEPIAYASVTVFKTLPSGKDSLIGGALTIENGDFNVTALPMGAFKVRVSFVGNQDLVKPIKISPPNNLEQDLGNLLMAVDVQTLGTVEVKAEKATTTMNLEKRVFNVDKNLSAMGGTAEDVLKNVPSVTVDMDGGIKLRERSATIYVDGKPTLMSLNQIPSDQIESVEVITNPSAKYEASTMGGILNIVLKNNRKPGYNGVLSLGLGNQDRYNGGLNLNLNKDKWSISGFYSINNSNVPSLAYVYRTGLTSAALVQDYYNQNSVVTNRNFFQTGRLNVDYALNNRNTISLAGTVSGGAFDFSVAQNYESLASNRQITNYGSRQTLSENDFTRNSLDLQWKKTYATKNKSLLAILNYSWGDKTNTSNWNTTGFDAQGTSLATYPQLVKINDASNNDQVLFQLDYVNPLNDSTKFEMGLRSFWNARYQNYFFKPFNAELNDFIVDTQFSQDANISESINAAYFLYAGRLKHHISYQAGLRFEQSNLTGISHLENQPDFGYTYPKGWGKEFFRSLFPSIFLSKDLGQNNALGLNFSRKIQRPNPQQFMPGIKSNDKQNIQIGNPALQPEFIDLAELNYNKIFGHNNWLISLYLSNETNTIKPLTLPSETDPTVLVTKFVNGTNELTYGIDNTLKLAFGKNFDVLFNSNVFRFNVNVDTFSNSGWAANGKVGLNYRLPASFSLQLNAAYEGNRPIPQGSRQGIAYMDFAVKRSFFKNAANLVFSINDVFNTRKDITTLTLPTYIQESMRRRDTRYFKLSLQIPFGKADASLFKKSNKKPEVPEMQEF